MAKFLDGAGVQSALTDIIKNADKELVLISPYLKISQQTKQYLNSIDKKINSVKTIYRTDFEISNEDLEFFKTLNNLKLFHCDNLHLKCYVNESTGLITSMNLHEHSQTRNWEMGVRFSKAIDPDIYHEVRKELEHFANQSKLRILNKQVAESKQQQRAESFRTSVKKTVYKLTEAPNKGIFDKILDTVTGEAAYCIRCGDGMPKFDLHKPYCDRCYASWTRYKNPKYREKFCHGCGNETKDVISFEKPTCKSCLCVSGLFHRMRRMKRSFRLRGRFTPRIRALQILSSGRLGETGARRIFPAWAVLPERVVPEECVEFDVHRGSDASALAEPGDDENHGYQYRYIR